MKGIAKKRTDSANVEVHNPVDFFLQMLQNKNGEGSVDPNTMLTGEQFGAFKEGFVGLLRGVCDAIEKNANNLKERAVTALKNVQTMRVTLGEEPVDRNHHNSKVTHRPVAEKTQQNQMPQKQKIVVKHGSKSATVVEFITKKGTATSEEIREWAFESSVINPGGDDKKVIAARISVMLAGLKNKKLIILNIDNSGRRFYSTTPISKTPNSFKNRKTENEKPEKNGRKNGKKQKTNSATASILKTIVSAGSEGINSPDLASANPLIKNATLRGALRALIISGLIRNLVGGRGNKGVYVATEKGERAVAKKSVSVTNNDCDDSGDDCGENLGCDHDSFFSRGCRMPKHISTIDDYEETRPPPRTIPRAPRILSQKEILLPERPTPRPKKPAKLKRPTTSEEWEDFIITLLEDWRWKITFEQVVEVVKDEAPYYGFDIATAPSAYVRLQLSHAVQRLNGAKKLVLSDDRNTLSPPA